MSMPVNQMSGPRKPLGNSMMNAIEVGNTHRNTTSSQSAFTTAGGEAGRAADVEKSPLMDVNEFASKLACSAKHVRRMADSGRCPPPIQLGGLRRWNRQVVDDWIAAGCPVVRQVRISSRK